MGGLEDYKIVRCVGKGSFGKVYLCRHLRENRHYCMKCIKLTNIPAAERAACRHEVKLMHRRRSTSSRCTAATAGTCPSG